MEEFSVEGIDYLKQHVPGFTEFLNVPDDEKDAYLINKINEQNTEYGLATIDRLLTDEELDAAVQRTLHPQTKAKPKFLNRFRRAWAILWGKEG